MGLRAGQSKQGTGQKYCPQRADRTATMRAWQAYLFRIKSESFRIEGRRILPNAESRLRPLGGTHCQKRTAHQYCKVEAFQLPR